MDILPEQSEVKGKIFRKIAFDEQKMMSHRDVSETKTLKNNIFRQIVIFLINKMAKWTLLSKIQSPRQLQESIFIFLYYFIFNNIFNVIFRMFDFFIHMCHWKICKSKVIKSLCFFLTSNDIAKFDHFHWTNRHLPIVFDRRSVNLSHP